MSIQSNSAQGTQRQAALYLRMSTDRQKYSIENQACMLYAYAVEHELEVVKQFCDEAKSGLTFEGRPAMRQLIEEVKTGSCGFNFILTYDVSRWGRFQDADESAYYDHICRQAGVQVIYCAEGFDAYEGPISSVLKSLKRTLAAEYSRDLSQKVADARLRMGKAGLYTGGQPRFGLRRVVINKDGEVAGTVEEGCFRRQPGDRLVVRPGPESERAVVRRIFLQFTESRFSIRAIVRGLNEDPMAQLGGRQWTFAMVRNLLTDERYIGNVIFRSFHQRGQIERAKTPTQIIRHEAVFDPIVPAAHFQAAIERFSQTGKHLDDAVLLEKLKKAHAENGRIATRFLSGRHGTPSSVTYSKHFGGLINAYRAAGIEPRRNYAWIELKAANKLDRVKIMGIVASRLQAQGHNVELNYKNYILNVDAAWGMHIKLVRAKYRKTGYECWTFSLVDAHRTDLLLLLRLNQDGWHMEDMYLVPTLSIRRSPAWLTMARNTNLGTDMYRIHAISDISPLATRYLADVEDCMVHFGRTQQDIDKSYLARKRWQVDLF